MVRFLALVVTLAFVSDSALAQRKKKKTEEELTQVLELPKDPPASVTVETRRLQFFASPLSAKGLLSQQTRDGLKALQAQSRGAQIVKIRALVAGSGDLRRVPAIISDVFTEKKLPLPAVSAVQVGGLPLEGAQVVLEATAVGKKEVNPAGLLFLSGQQVTGEHPLEPVAALTRKSVDNLKAVLTAAASTPADVLRVTCLLSTLSDIDAVRRIVATDFPQASSTFVQVSRAPVRSLVECEAIAKLKRAPASAYEMVTAPGLEKSANYSQAIAVGSAKVVLTGLQVAYGFEEKDARRAFDRLDKVLADAGTSMKKVAMSSLYPLSNGILAMVRKVRFDYYDPRMPPASTALLFEGLPGMEAAFGVDVVAVP